MCVLRHGKQKLTNKIAGTRPRGRAGADRNGHPARTEQSTHPVRDAQWARLLDLLIGAAIRRTYRWVSRINFPEFRAKGIERCAPCVIPFQI